jgi:hypothetical protein
MVGFLCIPAGILKERRPASASIASRGRLGGFPRPLLINCKASGLAPEHDRTEQCQRTDPNR